MSQTPDDIVLLATKSRVLAISRTDGRTLWERQLSGAWGPGFVTLVSDSESVFAHNNGKLFCLDVETGELLWTNELPGCGYGLASIALPGGQASTDPAVIQAIRSAQAAAAASSTAGPR